MKGSYSFEKLHVWQESILLTEKIYQLTTAFPAEEKFGLTSQLRRASSSIALNIAEGRGRFSRKEFIHFLYIARGSLYEVITCIELALRLGFLPSQDVLELQNLIFKIQSQLSGLINSMKEKT